MSAGSITEFAQRLLSKLCSEYARKLAFGGGIERKENREQTIDRSRSDFFRSSALHSRAKSTANSAIVIDVARCDNHCGRDKGRSRKRKSDSGGSCENPGRGNGPGTHSPGVGGNE